MRRSENRDKYNLYRDAFYHTVKACVQNPEQDPEPFAKKLIVYGVKMVNAKPKPDMIIADEAIRNFRLTDAIQSVMGTLTPKEFVNLFPIAKDFDGHRYQTKDYFYTRDYIESLPQDEPIGDVKKVFNLLWEYRNQEINVFLVKVLGYADNLRRLEGQPSIMEAFCDEHGIKTYTMHTGPKGKQFMVDNETGKTCRIKRKMPRYLRAISGKLAKNKPI